MKTVTSSSQENTRKISKQFLSFGVILVRSHVTIMTSKKTALLLPLKKRGHTSQWFLHGVIILYDIYTVVQCTNIQYNCNFRLVYKATT